MWKRKKCVIETINQHTHLMEHVDRQTHHGKIVNNKNSFQVKGFPVFHQAGAGPEHTEVDQEDDYHWDRRVHQQPWVCPLIWKTMEYSGFPTFFSFEAHINIRERFPAGGHTGLADTVAYFRTGPNYTMMRLILFLL